MDTSALEALGGLGGLPPAGLAAAGEAGAAGRAETGDSPAGPLEKGDLENGDLLSVESFDDMVPPPAKCYRLIIPQVRTSRHHQKTIL